MKIKGTFWGRELGFCYLSVEPAAALGSFYPVSGAVLQWVLCSPDPRERNAFCWKVLSSSETQRRQREGRNIY